MDFESEPFVKIFTTVSPTARLWGFFGRLLMDALVKAADKAGVIELPRELRGDLPAAVASVLDCSDVEWMRKHLPKLMQHGAVVLIEADEDGEECFLVLTRYHEAQYSNMNKSLSNRMSDRKRKDTERAINLGLIKPPFWWAEKEPEEGAA